MSAKQEWHDIAIYNAGCADTVKVILEHFGKSFSDEVVRYLNVEREYRLEKQHEAEEGDAKL